MKKQKVWVVLGMWRGLEDIQAVCSTPEKAEEVLKEYLEDDYAVLQNCGNSDEASEEWGMSDHCGSGIHECEVQE